MDEPQEHVWPRESLGHRELGGQFRRTRGGRHCLHAGHGPGPHGGHFRRQCLHFRKTPPGRQGICRGPSLGPGAAIAATQHFLGQRAFKEILFKNGLPFVFVFDGLAKKIGGQRTGPIDADDGTLVVLGDLGASYDRNRVLFRSVGLAKDARMELDDGGGKFVLYDFYANPLPSHGGKIIVPLNSLGYFLRSDGSPGSFAGLLKAVAAARISGVDPVEIVASDMTAPISARPAVRIKLTNVLNRPIEGKLAVKIEGLSLDPGEQTVTLAAAQTKELSARVIGGQAAADNNYRLTADFDAGSDGAVKHVELVHANVIARRTITVDGNLDDWKGVVPQTAAQSVATSMTEKAYLPFKDFGRQGSGVVTAYLAYDAKNFYFAAAVPKMDDMPRFETRHDDDYFYPEKFQSRGKELTWPAGVRRYSYRKDFEIPSGNGKHNVQIAFNVLPPERKAMLPFPAGTMPRFCAYPDTDYEFALNKVGEAYGGGTEIFCLLRPGARGSTSIRGNPRPPSTAAQSRAMRNSRSTATWSNARFPGLRSRRSRCGSMPGRR